MTTIGFSLVTHKSDELRPDALELSRKMICSIRQNLSYPFKIAVVDNGSSDPLEFRIFFTKLFQEINLPDENYTVVRIENQYIRGISGGWNDGVMWCYQQGCDIITTLSDDLLFNKTINDFYEQIKIHPDRKNSIYGPVSNKSVHWGNDRYPGSEVADVTNNPACDPLKREKMGMGILHGFSLTMTKESYENMRTKEGHVFTEAPNNIWGGQEHEAQRRVWASSGRSFVVTHCYVEHVDIKKPKIWKTLYGRR